MISGFDSPSCVRRSTKARVRGQQRSAQPHDHRQVQGLVGGPIATAMQSMPLSPPARCRDRCHAAEMGKGGS